MTSPIADGAGPFRPTDESTHPFGWRFTAPLYVGTSMNPVNSSLIATALVPIATGVHVSVGQTSLLVSVIFLSSAICQPTAGKLAEVFGPRRIYMGGAVILLIGGLLGGLAKEFETLVVSRALIGVGTSAGYPAAMMIIRRRAHEVGLAQPPGNVLSGITIASTVTATVGLPLGGVLVATLGWRSAFLINVPIAVVALIMAGLWIPKDASFQGSRRARDIANQIDAVGIAGFAAAIIAMLVFLLSFPHPSWIALGIAIILGTGLVWFERRAIKPFLDVRMLAANLPLSRTYARIGLSLLGVYTVLYGLTQWLEAARGVSTEEAGLLIVPMTALAIVIVRPIGRRNLVRGPLVAAALSALLGSIGLLLLQTSTGLIFIIIVTLVFGVTVGTATIGNQTTLYLQAPPEQVGTAAGLFRTAGYTGSIISSAITSVFFHNSVGDAELHRIAGVLVGVSVLLLLLTVTDRGIMRYPRGNDQGGGTTARQ
jgi:MFS family permease